MSLRTLTRVISIQYAQIQTNKFQDMLSVILFLFYLSSFRELILKWWLLRCATYLDVSKHFSLQVCLICNINNCISVEKILKTIPGFVMVCSVGSLLCVASASEFESTVGKPLIPVVDPMPGYKLCTGSHTHLLGGDLQHLYQVVFSELSSFLYLQWKSHDFAFAWYKSYRHLYLKVRVPN